MDRNAPLPRLIRWFRGSPATVKPVSADQQT